MNDETLNSIKTLKDYVNSFTNISIAKAKGRLSGAEISEESWIDEDGDINGIEVTALFDDYEMLLFVNEEIVVMATIQVLADVPAEQGSGGDGAKLDDPWKVYNEYNGR